MRMQDQFLASLSGLRIWCCHELWGRLEATALIGPLAWEPPYAAGAAQEKKQTNQPLKFVLKLVICFIIY